MLAFLCWWLIFNIFISFFFFCRFCLGRSLTCGLFRSLPLLFLLNRINLFFGFSFRCNCGLSCCFFCCLPLLLFLNWINLFFGFGCSCGRLFSGFLVFLLFGYVNLRFSLCYLGSS